MLKIAKKLTKKQILLVLLSIIFITFQVSFSEKVHEIRLKLTFFRVLVGFRAYFAFLTIIGRGEGSELSLFE